MYTSRAVNIPGYLLTAVAVKTISFGDSRPRLFTIEEKEARARARMSRAIFRAGLLDAHMANVRYALLIPSTVFLVRASRVTLLQLESQKGI